MGAAYPLIIAVLGGFVWLNRRQETQRERDARAMQARIDSVLAASDAAVQSLKGQGEGLADALRRSQGEVERLSGQLASARASGNAQQV